MAGRVDAGRQIFQKAFALRRAQLANVNPALVPAAVNVVEEVLVIGKKLRRLVADSALRFVRRGGRRDLSACRRHTPEPAGFRTCEEDRAVGTPTGARAPCQY